MLDGPSGCAGGLEVMQRLRQRARVDRIPLSVSMSLTHCCNLQCVHCYARTSADPGRELATAEWCAIADQLAEAGSLFVVLTGGEPLLRPDFADIYRHARERGMLLTVFTNATLVDASSIALWKDWPPRQVEVTLYGMSEETYRKVTGVAGMFDRVWMNVARMLEARVRVGLKAVVMTHNRHEIPAMEDAAQRLGVEFRLDGAIFPRQDGDRGPLGVRLPADEVAAIEMSNPRRAAQWRSFFARHRRAPVNGGALYRCSAGVTHAHVDPAGTLRPCLMSGTLGVSLRERRLPEAWGILGTRMQALRLPCDSPCIECDKHVLCGYCPGFSGLEAGDEARVCDYQCRLGEARLRYMQDAN